MKTTTGTTTKELFDQYYSTSNVVTRSSILSSLKSRVERGDDMSGIVKKACGWSTDNK